MTARALRRERNRRDQGAGEGCRDRGESNPLRALGSPVCQPGAVCGMDRFDLGGRGFASLTDLLFATISPQLGGLRRSLFGVCDTPKPFCSRASSRELGIDARDRRLCRI
jgi:hypothetical protein